MESILELLTIMSLNDSQGGSSVTETCTYGKRQATASADVTSLLQAPYAVTVVSMRSLLDKVNYQLLAIRREADECVSPLERAREGAKVILPDIEALAAGYDQLVPAPLRTITDSSMRIISEKILSQLLVINSNASEHKRRISSVCEGVEALVMDIQTILAWFEKVHPTPGSTAAAVVDMMTAKASFAELLSQVLALRNQRPADVAKANVKCLIDSIRPSFKELSVKKRNFVDFKQRLKQNQMDLS